MALEDLFEQIKLWPLKRKITFILVILISFGLMWGIVAWSEREEFQVLFSNLGPQDAGNVVGKLKEMKIPYRVEGNVIFVPSTKVYETRLDLAAQGIPQGGGIGFEIFDKAQIGVTEFVQRLNYRRALQGELSRTIKNLSEVDEARVHIAIPERTIFSDRNDRPTASVVVKVKPGRVLNQNQIGGIVHLVSSSVEGMTPYDVSVIDNIGNLLSKSSSLSSAGDSMQLDYQKSLEKDYESRLQSMMEGIVGRGKAIVRVATKIDFTQSEKTEERFDPDTIAVRSEQRSQEKSTGAVSGGIPGVLSNQPGQAPAQTSASGAVSQKQTESINYEVSRSVSRTVRPKGDLKSISVAVLVDGTYKKEGKNNIFVPRPDVELKKYEELVRAAVGFNQERGDQVTVQNVPFETTIEELTPEKTDIMKIVLPVLKFIVPMVVALLLIMFAIKPIVEILKAPIKMAPRPRVAEYAGEPEVLRTVESSDRSEKQMKEQITEAVKRDPRKSAMILKDWMTTE
ncbi:MAG: flagellar M-ring protein FliF [Nitrospiraceae bacterium]|nr:flagellar M-ring protein FliF [Nitrospiraceae bacterium]